METIAVLIQNKEYSHVTDQCRELEPDVPLAPSPNVSFWGNSLQVQTGHDTTFYSIYILGHLIQNELYTPQTR